MKVLVLASKSRYDAYPPTPAQAEKLQFVFCDREAPEQTWLDAAADAEAISVTPVTPITESLISQMPNLRVIHSEGVGFDRIDFSAAAARGIYVCNCAGINAPAVAELSITLMSMLLRRLLWGDRMTRQGRQAEAVRLMEQSIPADLAVSTVGLVGFGAIGQAVAERLKPYGAKILYYAPHRRAAEVEERLGAQYLPLDQLIPQCDIISLHMPATAESHHMVNAPFLRQMKPGAYLVNTARGAIIDDDALCAAIRSGQLGGAALDCYEPEPAESEHPLVRLAAEYPDRLILSPHHGGLAHSAFTAGHILLFQNLTAVAQGQRPQCIVNGL